MKAASTLIQAIALSACFAVQMDVAGERVPGVRRALQTIEAAATQAASARQAAAPLARPAILHRA